MTPEQEAEALQLEIEVMELEKAKATAVPRGTPKPEVDALTAAGRGAAQGLTAEFGDELQGAIQAAGIKMLPEALGGGDARESARPWGDLYRENRDAARRENHAAQESSPVAYGASNIGGGLLSSFALPGGSAKTLLRAMATGAGGGALGAAGASEAEDAGGLAGDVAGGALGGAALGGMLHGGLRLLKRAGRPVTPSAEAQFLRDEGVDLTVGQMNPRGVLGQMESANTNLMGIGQAIDSQRAGAAQQFISRAAKEGIAPGDKLAGEVLPEQLTNAAEGFNDAYSAIKNAPTDIPMSQTDLRRAFKDAIRGSGDPILASTEEKKAVARFLEDQLSVASNQAPRPADTDVLMKMRSNIRARLRPGSGEAPLPASQAQMLRNAEKEITRELERILPDDAVKTLRETDRRYRNFKVLEETSYKAGDRAEGPTATMLSRALRQGTGKSNYARGGGGDLRPIAAAGAEVFREFPKTGAAILATGPARLVTAPLNWAANTKHIKPFMIGEGLGQEKARAIAEALLRMGPERLARPTIGASWGEE